MTDKILWKPRKEYAENSQMKRFLELTAARYGLENNDYQTVHQWSVNHPGDFWAEIWDFCEVKYSQPYKQVVDNVKKMPGAKWFEGAKLNFAENLLRKHNDDKAIIFIGETKVRRELTYNELYEQVRRASVALRNAGVTKNDHIAALMPNMPETVIMMLAVASIGATWSSTSPDFGTKGVLDRFSQIKPKIILAADGYFYKGKTFILKEKIKQITEALPSVQKVVLVDYTGNKDTGFVPEAVLWDDFVVPTGEDLSFEQLPFDHPLYIMFSSGTTGLPKSIIHTAGGTLLQHLKELMLHSNIMQGQKVFYYTTCGWMMWNWFVSALATGATLVLYDGNPFYPGPEVLLRMAAELGISFFGTSAKYLTTLETMGVKPKKISHFPELKVIASTGSPLPESGFEYVYREWKSDVQLSSIAGGTDIISCFMLGNPVLPVYKGEIQCKGLGMDVDCFDDNGNSLVEKQGELVCKTAFPSMPAGFLNDPENKRFLKAYFDVFPGIWHHGDYIVITKHGGIIMQGRSDATLNPQGIRIGTAEIYRVVEKLVEIDDSVAVGKKLGDDEIVVLFVKLNEGYELTGELQKKIKDTIGKECSPRHIPALIKAVPDIPYTINGKKVEIAVKKLINGQEVTNISSLANPGSLKYFTPW